MASRTPGKPATTRRQLLGSKLRSLRALADRTNEDMAKVLNTSSATISRMEKGDRVPSAREIEAWVRATGASSEMHEELLELARNAHTQVTSWFEAIREGLHSKQIAIGELEASAGVIWTYEHIVIPGLLQVRDYAHLTLKLADVVGVQDFSAAVEQRMHRQALLLDQSRQFAFLITEAALLWRPGSIELQLQQFERIAAVANLPNVDIGLLPLRGQAAVIYPESFNVYAGRAEGAETIATVELVPDEVTLDREADVKAYQETFEQLQSAALFDEEARTLLEQIAEDFRRNASSGS
jgi:transcriptional regulator with XRE-family HTH domain